MDSTIGRSPGGSILPIDNDGFEIPIIDDNESLVDVVRKLSGYITQAIPDVYYSFEQMRSSDYGQNLRLLVHSLAENSHNPSIIIALMIIKWRLANATDDDWGLNESRGFACEYVAWQFLCHLTQHETIEFLLEELPTPKQEAASIVQAEAGTSGFGSYVEGTSSWTANEDTPLLWHPTSSLYRWLGGQASTSNETNQGAQSTYDESYAAAKYSQFYGLNGLEIAVIAQAKRFLSQKAVQRVIGDIWNGEIVFWDSLSVHTEKKPRIFNKRTADIYSRLRVPVYRKAFEAAFFVSFLIIYYTVLVVREPNNIGSFEALMYLWIVAFAYDQLSGMVDTGMLFYQMDFWSVWNIGIIGTGLAFVIARIVGRVKESDSIADISFDILSLQALFLVPRICSLVSLNSYFGSLLPVLKEMTKAFFQFLPVVFILYIGFLTTFTMLARDRLSLKQMSMILVKVFFGSTNLGFVRALRSLHRLGAFVTDVAELIGGQGIAQDISPIFGYGLMLIFVSMTNILLISSLVSLMSMSLEGVMLHAREEYLFQLVQFRSVGVGSLGAFQTMIVNVQNRLSIYVLECCNSRRLTYFMPPLNLILLCIRPMRLFLSAESVRRVRIILLRATHLPFAALIWLYELSRHQPSRRKSQLPPIATNLSTHHGPPRTGIRRPDTGQHPEARGPSPGQPGGRIEIVDVIDEVERLRTQVERVAARTAAFQQQGT